ncbi:MAG: hypothetical protein D6706_10115 [Chloroflexi bacterium]|nr:MAG: hypothetical protein D6706_10115 [Chloroflexota bacterium]
MFNQPHNHTHSRTLQWLNRQWKRLPPSFRWNLEDTFQPEDISERLLPYEEPQLEIRMAWYRDIFGHIFFDYFGWFLGTTVVATAVLAYFSLLQHRFSNFYILIPGILFILMLAIAIRERVEYNQWRILKTNARLIISIPQHGAFPLVDNIELKDLPKVIDTNWSPNPLWRVFQFFTGARDLYLSLAAYKFVEGTARVGDALIIPDIMPQDVYELRKLVFQVKK